MATYRLDDGSPHAFWDNTLPPRLTVKPGDTVIFETLEASAGQITARIESGRARDDELRSDSPADRAGVRQGRGAG